MAPATAVAGVEPPVFLGLAGNPLRWRLLSELARSDRRVGELVELVGQPQNAVSYHLARLRAGGVVSVRDSSADRRDKYYTLDLARCGELLAAAGAALHPGLVGGAVPRPAPVRRTRPVRVLFACTGNSSRSQIAEALLGHIVSPRAVAVASAGSRPKPLHPYAVRVIREHGIDWSGHRSKHFDELAGPRFDYVVTLCDKLRENCPDFPGAERIHWSIPDPSEAAGRASYPAFRRVAADLRTRTGYLAEAIAPTTTTVKGAVP